MPRVESAREVCCVNDGYHCAVSEQDVTHTVLEMLESRGTECVSGAWGFFLCMEET